MQDLGEDFFSEPKQSATPTDASSQTAVGLGLVEGEDRHTVLGTRSWWHLQLRPVKFAEVSFVEQCLDRTASLGFL